NTGDDAEIWGLHVSPDLDTVCYMLAGLIDEAKGWGVRDESFRALEHMVRFGEPTWFNLGDRDLATHLHRTRLLREGRSLSEATRSIAGSLGVTASLIPMSDQPHRSGRCRLRAGRATHGGVGPSRLRGRRRARVCALARPARPRRAGQRPNSRCAAARRLSGDGADHHGHPRGRGGPRPQGPPRTGMNVFAAVPVKDLTNAKQRLIPALTADQRRRLAQAMLEDGLKALGAALAGSVHVVTTDAEVMELARR